MNKNELITCVAEKAGLTKADSTKAVEAVLASVTETLQKGEDVRLVGFGTFYVSKSAARQGRNPRSGEVIQIPASNNAKFKAGKALKEAVN